MDGFCRGWQEERSYREATLLPGLHPLAAVFTLSTIRFIVHQVSAEGIGPDKLTVACTKIYEISQIIFVFLQYLQEFYTKFFTASCLFA